MPHVRVEERVRAAPRAVYDLFRQVETFPDFMPNVESIEVVERGEGWAVSQWHTDLDGAPLEWKERDEYDPEALRIRFNLLEGDIAQLEGHWAFEPCEDGTLLVCEFDYDLGVPLVEEVVGATVREKLQHNIEEMLRAARKRLEPAGAQSPCEKNSR